MMNDTIKFSALVDDIWKLVFGTIRRPEVQLKHAMKQKPKRARGKKGKFLADDPTTAFTNEAWVGGKAPKKGKKK